MSNTKFKSGDSVSFFPKTALKIKMAQTVVVGFDSVRPFNWTMRKCEIAGDIRPRRITNGRKENRYVIEHFYGWYPSVQTDINPDLKASLDVDKRYAFAYESELRLNDVGEKMGKNVAR